MYHLSYVDERAAAARRRDLRAEADNARRVNQVEARRITPVLARAAARWGGPVRVLRGTPNPAPTAA